MAHRYFTSDIDGGEARITGADAAHLARVLRAKPGQRLTLCDGAGTDYEGEIISVGPEEITLRVLQSRPSDAEPALWAEVFIGMAKGERMDWAVQKAVELGASAIHPFYSENAVVKPKNDEEKARRFGRIAAEAAKQSGRGILPAVAVPCGFDEALERAINCGLALLLHEKAGVPLRAALKVLPAQNPRLAILSGPEGGFSPSEADRAAAAGCVSVNLGPRILRCETAPAAALAAVMALTGNLE